MFAHPIQADLSGWRELMNITNTEGCPNYSVGAIGLEIQKRQMVVTGCCTTRRHNAHELGPERQVMGLVNVINTKGLPALVRR